MLPLEELRLAGQCGVDFLFCIFLRERSVRLVARRKIQRRMADDFVTLAAVNLQGLQIAVHEAPVLEQENGVVGGIEQRTEFSFVVLDLLARLHHFRDVLVDDKGAGYLSLGTTKRHGGIENGLARPVEAFNIDELVERRLSPS
jgi:hypothetical protein